MYSANRKKKKKEKSFHLLYNFESSSITREIVTVLFFRIENNFSTARRTSIDENSKETFFDPNATKSPLLQFQRSIDPEDSFDTRDFLRPNKRGGGERRKADDPVILQRQLPPTRGLRFLKGGECLGGGRETHNILFFVPLERLLAV